MKIDLAVRFGREPASAGKRAYFLIVEILYAIVVQVLGLMVDGVNVVMNISKAAIEADPAFGLGVSTDFVARVLSIDEVTVGADAGPVAG